MIATGCLTSVVAGLLRIPKIFSTPDLINTSLVDDNCCRATVYASVTQIWLERKAAKRIIIFCFINFPIRHRLHTPNNMVKLHNLIDNHVLTKEILLSTSNIRLTDKHFKPVYSIWQRYPPKQPTILFYLQPQLCQIAFLNTVAACVIGKGLIDTPALTPPRYRIGLARLRIAKSVI